MFCGLAAFAMLCSSCIHIDHWDYYRFNDVQITEPLTGLDIEWRDSRVDICYWDKPYTRIYDNADMVVMLNRPENEINEPLKYIGKFREQDIKNTAELIVMKSKGEKSDTRYLIGFEAPSTAFYELEV